MRYVYRSLCLYLCMFYRFYFGRCYTFRLVSIYEFFFFVFFFYLLRFGSVHIFCAKFCNSKTETQNWLLCAMIYLIIIVWFAKYWLWYTIGENNCRFVPKPEHTTKKTKKKNVKFNFSFASFFFILSSCHCRIGAKYIIDECAQFFIILFIVFVVFFFYTYVGQLVPLI